MTIAVDQRWSVIVSDAVAFLASLPSQSVDAVISDPPYPEIDRSYGRLTEAEWHALMRAVVAECRRILKPRGSAVFILQPNSERVGRMRPWLWEFMAWTASEWNQVQDAWWWNIAAMPTVHTHRTIGLMRPSLKACVWLGADDCYRAQDRVLWTQSEANAAVDRESRAMRVHPSGHHVRAGQMSAAADDRGGVTPFNVIAMANTNSSDSAGTEGHGAGTPLPLAAWWTRYIVPVGGHVVDPFVGRGTMGIAAVEHGATFAGADKMPEYVEIARRRIAKAARQGMLDFGAEPGPTKNA